MNIVKTAAAAALAVLLVTFTGCAWMEDLFAEKEDFSDVQSGETGLTDEEKLLASLASYTEDPVVWSEYGDFDGDAVYEAFVLTGVPDSELGGYLGVPWFLTADYAAELAEKGSWSQPEMWNIGGDAYMKTEQLSSIDSLTRLFGVEGSKVFEPAVSGRMMELSKTGENDFTALASAYDAMQDVGTDENGDPLEIGHTYKKYWFYYEDGIFKEYGALDDYKRADLREFETGGAILDELLAHGITAYQYEVLEKDGPLSEDARSEIAADAGYIRNIMKRANGLWHLNYYGADDENYYVTFQEKDGDLLVVDEGSGYYLPALCEDMAVYPVEEEAQESESSED